MGDKTGMMMRGCALALAIMAAVAAAGCGKKSAEEEDEAVVQGITYLTEDELVSGNFYIESTDEDGETVYAQVYFGDTDSDMTDYGEGKIAWFSADDWDMIPTMYEGDKLVYIDTDEFSETFTLERYMDEGWSIGISGLYLTDAGYYKVYVGTDGLELAPASTAYTLSELGDVDVVIDIVGDMEIREGAVSDTGYILGLEQGETYQVDVYLGTYLYEYELTADTRLLISELYEETLDFSYRRSTTIEIAIPEGYNSGYYSINGMGLFRCVAGDSYDDDTDFNVSNAETESTGVDEASETIDISESGYYSLTVSYSEYTDEDEGDGSAPEGSIDIDGTEYVLFEDGTRVVSAEFYADSGSYELSLTGLQGRLYQITLTRLDSDEISVTWSDSPDEEESTSEEEESTADTGEGTDESEETASSEE